MGYKQRVQNELKGAKLGSLWQEICESYELGGIDKVKELLNSLIYQKKKDYKQFIQILEKKL